MMNADIFTVHEMYLAYSRPILNFKETDGNNLYTVSEEFKICHKEVN